MSERHPLGKAETVAQVLIEVLKPLTDGCTIAGSIRRRKAYVKDIEIVAMPQLVPDGFLGDTKPNSGDIKEAVSRLGHLTKGGEKYVQIENLLGSGLTLDLFLVTPPAEWGPILAIRTGPAAYSQRAVSRIRGRLWRCEAGSITDEKGGHVPCPTEEDFFNAARMQFLPPWERRA